MMLNEQFPVTCIFYHDILSVSFAAVIIFKIYFQGWLFDTDAKQLKVYRNISSIYLIFSQCIQLKNK